ncbi:MAG TPA: SMP-30/gluconolactonase/LRE family protein [Steroidobacteraceae bacterium]|nr:SMP-30/gluconolactonase/LRE family protein [Steroidobacteraceae bacterium]
MTRKFAEQLGFPEAPVVLPDGSFLFVEMDPAKGWTIRFSPDGKTRSVVARTGRPNGLAADRKGNIWVAETAMRALLRLTLEGKYEVVVSACEGEPFLFLNDLALASNGDIYLTDSGIEMEDLAPRGQLNPDYRNLKYDGRVFRIDPTTRTVERVDRGLQFANGIAFGPDENLYVAETLSGNIYRYECAAGRATGKRKLFGNVIERFDPGVLQGPDGMKFGADGSLYVAVFGQGDVTILGRNGAVTGRLKTAGAMPTNLVFGPRGEKKIYVTEVESGSVQVLDVATEGLPLHL